MQNAILHDPEMDDREAYAKIAGEFKKFRKTVRRKGEITRNFMCKKGGDLRSKKQLLSAVRDFERQVLELSEELFYETG